MKVVPQNVCINALGVELIDRIDGRFYFQPADSAPGLIQQLKRGRSLCRNIGIQTVYMQRSVLAAD